MAHDRHLWRDRVAAWSAGGAGLLWAIVAVFPFFMNGSLHIHYKERMTLEQTAWMAAAPDWIAVLFAVGVWTALCGSILLTRRTILAIWVLAVPVIALGAVTVWALTTRGMPALSMEDRRMIAIFPIVAAFQLAAALWMRRAGIIHSWLMAGNPRPDG